MGNINLHLVYCSLQILRTVSGILLKYNGILPERLTGPQKVKKKIPRILRTPYVHYRIHKSLSPPSHPYPGPEQSSPRLRIPLLEDQFFYFFPTHA